jgi:hypothetical protein
MDDFYAKSIKIDLSLNHDMKMLSELAAPFGGYKKLNKFINKKNLKEQKRTIFDYDLSDSQDPNFKRNLMTCFWSLLSKENHMVSNGSLDIFNYVSAKTANHLLGIVFLNTFQCKYKCNIIDASSIGLFRSLINHSCFINASFVHIDNKLVTVVVRPVKAGEQLFQSYYNTCSPDHAIFRELTMKMYDFECDCQKCIDNHQYKPIQISNPMTFTNRKCLQIAKEILKREWHFINTNTNDMPEVISENIYQGVITLIIVAGFATFPC